MQAVITNWQPRNRITIPLAGAPSYINSGIIKAVMKSGEKVSVAQIDYQEFDEENFQYVISPYWEIVDGLPASVFQGIPGIDMDLRLQHYYRVNYIPTFIAERTPSENREDLWDLLESVGLDYYDRFEWLLRTKLRSSNDNLIVDRMRPNQIVEEYTSGILQTLQYGDKVIVESLESIADTTTTFSDFIFTAVTTGIDVIGQTGHIFIDAAARSAMVPTMVVERIISRREQAEKRTAGIEQAKKDGKYAGRKPLQIDAHLLLQVSKELNEGLITVEEAMVRTGIKSRSTFYRKLQKINQ